METNLSRLFFRNQASLWRFAFALALAFQFSNAQSEPLKLISLDFTTLPGDSLQVQLSLSGPAFSPKVFHTENPARIALDLPGVSSLLEKKPIPVNVSGAESIQAIAASDRTRVVINLTDLLPYSTRVEGNNIYVELRKGKLGNPPRSNTGVSNSPATPAYSQPKPVRAASNYSAPVETGIRNIDFRRGEKGVGRVLVSLADPKMVPNIREEGRKVIASFPNGTLPAALARRLDVMDFATPVQYIESSQDGNGVKLVITPTSDDFDFSSYQSDNQLTIEFRPLTKIEKEEIKKKAFSYSGDKLSLNFQDIPVRSVLQILGDFTNKNIVASDTVGGNVTLRLNDVPWDQALALVLKAKNLGKREDGNIIQILPMDELNKQTEDELKAQKVVDELEPLKTEIIQINYTNAEDIKKVLVATTEKTTSATNQAAGGGIGGNSNLTVSTSVDVSQLILTGRGNVTVDPRTNQLIVRDTPRSLEKVRELVRQLDIAVRQVLIESRIVIANNDFSRELGSRFSFNANSRATRKQVIKDSVTGQDLTLEPLQSMGGNAYTNGDALSDLGTTGAVAGPGGAIGFTVLKVGEYLLDLELSAAQREGRGEIVSNPRLVTSDQTKAVIKQGVQIPYQSTVNVGGGGATTISFKDALLELNVTPHITPDDNIRMELIVKKDSKGEQIGPNVAIDKREINTTTQVANGDTVVLGGVYENTKTTGTDKVPFLGDLPAVGFMFRRNAVVDQKKELLIFITPKILKQYLGQR